MSLKNLLSIGIFLFFSSLLIAQSDYRITQEFKSRQRSFEIAIEYAKTDDELNKIRKEITEFKGEFRGNKELLNRALYPSNFESSFTALDKKIEYTNKKLSEISGLNTKVITLESDYAKVSSELGKLSREVNVLKNSNSRLMTELKAFKSGYGGSKGSIDSLRNLVAELKQGISRRDTLIKEIMDNIFMTAEHKIESLNDAEKMGIQSQLQNTSLIDNIQNLISDNIEFLDASIFTPGDLSQLKTEFSDFEQRWSHFGPKLFDIYSTDEQNQEKLYEIDSLVANWNNSLDQSVWNSISDIFKSNNIELAQFNSGQEFEEVITSYIDSEINNDNSSANVKKDQSYVFFAERTWRDVFKPEWLPLLISDNLITTEQITSIENKISDWEGSLSGSKSYLIYGIIVLLAIIIIFGLIAISKKKNKEELTEEIEDINEKTLDKPSDIDDAEEFVDDNK